MSERAAERSAPAPNIKNRKQAPQKNIDDFWAAYTSKFPGKVTTILPQNKHAGTRANHSLKGPAQSESIKLGYERARKECYATVDKISKECRRTNRRYRDIHFDMEFDLKWAQYDCLEGLGGPRGPPFFPKSVKRVGQIFDKPQFYVDGASPTDIRQGYDGDCWFLSGLSACVFRDGWIDSVCVHRDELVGVYGFVFYRDGEWTYTVVDDRLYLTAADWDESTHEKSAVTQLNTAASEEEYRKMFQTGSRALYFAQCATENETWLPLIEKAYAKAHGDYRSIDGGFSGEGIEDLTGGVTTEIWTSDILDKDVFWQDLLLVNQEFLFACATGWSDNFLGGSYMTDRKGVVSMHAYSIMEAREVEGHRLVKLRNPWGKLEYRGAWSDGSKEWTAEWLTRLNHRFGDDGVFWMSFEDLCKNFSQFDRTRLFASGDWKVSQQWTPLDVAWSSEYSATKFEVEIKQGGRCVIVLSQLDDRYFLGLEGQYTFDLQFRIENKNEEGYIVRSNETYFMTRSCNVELDLDPGLYTVLIKVNAVRNENEKSPEHVIREAFKTKRDKLLAVGLAYDLAHAKAVPHESSEEKAAREATEKAERAAAKEKAKKAKRDEKWAAWEKKMRTFMRAQRTKERSKRHNDRKEEQKKAEKKAKAELKEKDSDKPEAKGPDAADKLESAPISSGNSAEDKPIDEKTAEGKKSNGDEEMKLPIDQSQTAEENKPAAQDKAEKTESDAMTEAEAKVKELMAQAEAIIAQARAGGNASTTVVDPAPSTANIPPTVATEGSNVDAQSEAIQTPTTSAATSKQSSEQGNKEPDATVPPVAPMPPSAPIPPQIAEEGGKDSGSVVAGSVAGSAKSSSISSVMSWVSSIDSKLDSIDYASSADSSSESEAEDEDNTAIANDPWNAICVVGLRVFSKSDSSIRVVKLPSAEMQKGSDAPLDVDDISKGESGEKSVAGQAEVNKQSVDGQRPPLNERQSYLR